MDKKERVKVKLMCPYCGHCDTLRTAKFRKAILCPACSQTSYLAWATGVEGELDEHGHYFHATEPFGLRIINREFEDDFYDVEEHWYQ